MSWKKHHLKSLIITIKSHYFAVLFYAYFCNNISQNQILWTPLFTILKPFPVCTERWFWLVDLLFLVARKFYSTIFFFLQKWKHASLNIFFTFTTIVVNFVLAFLVVWACDFTTEHKFGLLHWLPLDGWFFWFLVCFSLTLSEPILYIGLNIKLNGCGSFTLFITQIKKSTPLQPTDTTPAKAFSDLPSRFLQFYSSEHRFGLYFYTRPCLSFLHSLITRISKWLPGWTELCNGYLSHRICTVSIIITECLTQTVITEIFFILGQDIRYFYVGT